MKESSPTSEKKERSTTDTNDTKTHYEVLGVHEKADHTMIKNAHRKLALRYHPDKQAQKKNVNAKQSLIDSEGEPEEELLFTKIQSAWECLGDEKKRIEYDDYLERIRERNNGDIIKAQIVKLCEMRYEICEVEDDESVESNQSQEIVKQKLYTYNCRCGDCFEILEEEIDETNDSSSDSNIFECESCSLSIKVVL